MNISLREEKTAPFVTIKSLAMAGSETTTKSWLPSHIEKSGPNFFDQ